MSIPDHPHYDAMLTLLPAFTRESGIKVHVTRSHILRMKGMQLSEMSKPQGDFDLVSYVVMWKTEYVSKNLIHALAPFLKNPGLADPALSKIDGKVSYVLHPRGAHHAAQSGGLGWRFPAMWSMPTPPFC
jgi:multiple sugar transport system substrate-binding protein